jgi:hypothetical protein
VHLTTLTVVVLQSNQNILSQQICNLKILAQSENHAGKTSITSVSRSIIKGSLVHTQSTVPFIEERYPGLNGKLTLDIRFLPESTKDQGVSEFSLDFGLFSGTAALGIDKYTLADWCYRQHLREIPNPLHPPQHRPEACRLAKNVVHAHRKVCRDEGAKQGGLSRHKLLPKANLTKPPSLTLNARLQDTENLFMVPGSIFGSTGKT